MYMDHVFTTNVALRRGFQDLGSLRAQDPQAPHRLALLQRDRQADRELMADLFH